MGTDRGSAASAGAARELPSPRGISTPTAHGPTVTNRRHLRCGSCRAFSRTDGPAARGLTRSARLAARPSHASSRLDGRVEGL
jgi:hypothetical protein